MHRDTGEAASIPAAVDLCLDRVRRDRSARSRRAGWCDARPAPASASELSSCDSEQVLVVFECEEQLSEEPRERLALVWREGRDQPFLVLNVCGCDRVYGRKPCTGERDERATPIGGIGIAADEPAGFEPVETFCRAAT